MPIWPTVLIFRYGRSYIINIIYNYIQAGPPNNEIRGTSCDEKIFYQKCSPKLMREQFHNNIKINYLNIFYNIAPSPVGWGCKIHQMHLCRGVRDPTSALDMTLYHLLARLQPWSFEQCRVHLHCHYSQAHSDSNCLTIYGSNGTVWPFNCVHTYDWY